MTDIQQKLFALQDPAYRDFTLPLLPDLAPERMIGVRMPAMRALAKELYRAGEYEGFLAALPHEYHEENCLHAFLIGEIKDFDRCIEETERFLPFMDNWAVCDTLKPKAFRKNRAALLERIPVWLASGETYTLRFGVGMLMSHFLDEDFRPEYLDWVAAVQSEEYYVRMMIAWYFATALAKQYEAALPYIEQGRLERWTHNKTIQKAVESFRVSDEHKQYLKTLKR